MTAVQGHAPSGAADAHRLGELLTPLVRGQVFVLLGAPVRPLSAEANALLDLGALHVAIVGDGIGMYEPKPRDGLSWLAMDVEGGTVSEARTRATAQLSQLPQSALAALDAIDPHRDAWVINANNMCTDAQIGGRQVLGRSRAEWTALEDKTVCDELWAAAGIRHAPYEIVAANAEDLVGAARRLDRGSGTVWAGDSRDGVNGGADLTRWVRDEQDIEPVADLLGSHCDRARVMPFLEGVPCSIHGVLTVDGLAALRPCEMIVLRDESPGHLRFVGMGTAWDPDELDRRDMQDVARRVGALLRERFGFLGTFTVDGIMTDVGFLPTELNPRVGGALALMSEGIPETGLLLHTQFLAHEIDTGLRSSDIEGLVVAAADEHRGLLAALEVSYLVEPQERPIVLDERVHLRLARADEEQHGVVRSSLFRSYAPAGVVVNIDKDHLPIGPSSAGLVAAGLNLAGDAVGVPLGPFEAAPTVR